MNKEGLIKMIPVDYEVNDCSPDKGGTVKKW